MTQVKYIVGTGGALTRLPHREEIMREITRCNESGMLLLPGEHAQILVDHDYIMASLGVLSKRYPQAAARLLEQSLGITFPERKAEGARYPSATRSSPGLRPSGSSGKRSYSGTLRSARPWAMI